MSKEEELKIIEILEDTKDLPLSNCEILNSLEERYKIVITRQKLWRILSHYKKMNMVESILYNNKPAYILKKYNTKSKKELQFVFSELIKLWLEQLPQITASFGFCKATENKFEVIAYPILGFRKHPLFNDFKEYVESLLKENPDFCPNLFANLDDFLKNSREMYEKKQKLIIELHSIVEEEIGQDLTSKEDICLKLFEGIILGLDSGAGWKSEKFSEDWLGYFKQFHSIVRESSEFYDYFLRDLRFRDQRYFKSDLKDNELKFISIEEFQNNFLPIFTNINKGNLMAETYKKNMDFKIRNMLNNIAKSREIRENVLELYELKINLVNSINNMWEALIKIKSIKRD